MGMNQGGPGMDLRTGSGGEQMSNGRMAGQILNALRAAAAAQGRMNQPGGPGMEMYTDPRSNRATVWPWCYAGCFRIASET